MTIAANTLEQHADVATGVAPLVRAARSSCRATLTI
jgi:hypothetical protein